MEAPKETSNKITETTLLDTLSKEDLIKVIANIIDGDYQYGNSKLDNVIKKIGNACQNECNKTKTGWTLNENTIEWILNY